MRWDFGKGMGFKIEEDDLKTTLDSFVGLSEWIEETMRQRHCAKYDHCDWWFDERGIQHREGGAKVCRLCGAERRED